MGLMSLLVGYATINLVKPQTQISLDTSITTLVADLRSQQSKVMAGDTDSGSATPYGIFFETNQYTLFKGSSFVFSEPNNFVITLDPNLSFSTINLPSSQIIFARRSGEVTNFSAVSSSVVLRNASSNEQKTVTLNRYGVLTVD